MTIELNDYEKKLVTIGLDHYINDLVFEKHSESKKINGIPSSIYDTLITEAEKLKTSLTIKYL
jgi:hypothetical protein